MANGQWQSPVLPPVIFMWVVSGSYNALANTIPGGERAISDSFSQNISVRIKFELSTRVSRVSEPPNCSYMFILYRRSPISFITAREIG
eukprot:240901-Prorocentrum_minimum.AAC.6